MVGNWTTRGRAVEGRMGKSCTCAAAVVDTSKLEGREEGEMGLLEHLGEKGVVSYIKSIKVTDKCIIYSHHTLYMLSIGNQ